MNQHMGKAKDENKNEIEALKTAYTHKKWIPQVLEHTLRIRDVSTLSQGCQIQVLVLDRNVWCTAVEINEPNVEYTAEHFFRKNMWTFIAGDRPLKGKLVRGDSSDSYYYVSFDFEFEVEYAPSNWYPLKNGALPAKDPQGFASFSYDAPKLWDAFPSDTRIGYRGPMILRKFVGQLPNIYYSDRE